MAGTVFHITGTSRGIGKALVEYLLNGADASHAVRHVYGYARSPQNIQHPKFISNHLDLSDPCQVSGFCFPENEDAEVIVFIHNAGEMRPAGNVGSLPASEISSSLYMGVTAPALLVNKFLQTYGQSNKRLMWINISSGAAQRDLDGRSIYCTGKAGAEMFVKCCANEAKVRGDNDRVHFFSIAPGVVDTEMQVVMREEGKEKGFSDVDRFIELHEKKQLVSPMYVAQRLMDVVSHPSDYEVVYRIPAPTST